MLKKSKLLLLIASVAMLSFAMPAHAVVQGQLGGQDASGNYNIIIEDNIMKPSTGTGIYSGYINATTSQTLALTDSGKTIIFTGTVNSEFVLPACTSSTLGAEYPFVSGVGKIYAVDTNGTDVINYAPSGQLLAPGNKMTSPGATGDSVVLTCGSSGNWYYSMLSGAFTNGG